MCVAASAQCSSPSSAIKLRRGVGEHCHSEQSQVPPAKPGKAGGLKSGNRSKRSALRAEHTSHPPISNVRTPDLLVFTPRRRASLAVVCGRSPTGRPHKRDRNRQLSRGVGDPAHTIIAPVILAIALTTRSPKTLPELSNSASLPAKLEVYHYAIYPRRHSRVWGRYDTRAAVSCQVERFTV